MNYCLEFVPLTMKSHYYSLFTAQSLYRIGLVFSFFFFSHTVHTLLKVNAQQV